VVVSDSGPGVLADEIPLLLEKFSQTSGSWARRRVARA
jgi:signal transduction histidine kinase